jgi:hypothetical protein
MPAMLSGSLSLHIDRFHSAKHYGTLATFHRNICSFLTGSFAMAAAGILKSFHNIVVFVALTDIRLVNIIFQRDHTYYSNFSVNGFDFELTGHEVDLDIYFYTCTYRDFTLPFAFYGIDSSTPCGSLI